MAHIKIKIDFLDFFFFLDIGFLSRSDRMKRKLAVQTATKTHQHELEKVSS